MAPALIGNLIGFAVIGFIALLKGFEKWILYALTLTG